MKQFIRSIPGILLTILLSSLFCMGLYHYNNKYTHSSIQPYMGQLVIAQENTDQIHFIINNREFYPNVLMTPEDLISSPGSLYMKYTDIGVVTRFDNPKNPATPHGMGSYSLCLWLPEKSHIYALELPEIFSALSVYLGLRLKKKTAFLYAALCLTMCSIIAFPLIHTLFELPITPWYSLELFCIYLIGLLVVILYNQICNIERTTGLIATGICGIVLTAACFYGLFSAHLTIPLMQLFSHMVTCYKLMLGAYLLLAVFYWGNPVAPQAQPLYYGCVAYAVFLIFDRIYPSYEPIIGGWFYDWAGFTLTLFIGYSLGRRLVISHKNELTFAEEYRQIEKQLIIQKEYSRQLNDKREENQRITHDFRHHLRIITQMLERIKSSPDTFEHYEHLMAYVNQLPAFSSSSGQPDIGSFCNNDAVDALLQYYDLRTKENHITARFRFVLPSHLVLSEVELCTILGNLLENALEACCRLADKHHKEITLACRETKGLWVIYTENTYDGIYKMHKGIFLSRKGNSQRLGIGLESVKDIVERHQGTIDIFPSENLFRVGITLPL